MHSYSSKVERQQYLSVARALQPVLEQQAVLACKHLASTSNLSDLITSLADMTEERKTATAELDSMIRLVDRLTRAISPFPIHQGPAKRSPRLQLHHPTTFPGHLLARLETWLHLFHRQRLLTAEVDPLQPRHLTLPSFGKQQAQASLAEKPLTCVRQGETTPLKGTLFQWFSFCRSDRADSPVSLCVERTTSLTSILRSLSARWKQVSKGSSTNNLILLQTSYFGWKWGEAWVIGSEWPQKHCTHYLARRAMPTHVPKCPFFHSN